MTEHTPRARPTGSELAAKRESGVTVIVQLMAEGRWEKNGHVEFADKHGIAPATAANWAGEASRQLRAMEQLDLHALRNLATSRLQRYEKMAAERKRTFVSFGEEGARVHEVPDPDIGAAIKAVASWAKIEGLERSVQDLAQEHAADFVRVLLEDCAAELEPELYAKVHDIITRPRAVARKALPYQLTVKVEKT